MLIELYNNVKDRNTHSQQPLERITKWMQSNAILKQKTNNYRQWLIDNPEATKKQKSERKASSFPCVQFAATFNNSGTAKDINTLSGLIVIDIDHVTNIEDIKTVLSMDKFTYLLFTSPSNDGLKLVIRHDLNTSEQWKYLYQELETYYRRYNLITDASGSDISRMCFLPYAENLYVNPISEIWHYCGIPEHKQITKPESKEITNADVSDNALIQECEYLAYYLLENRINICETYEDWLLFGYSIAELQEDGRQIYHVISAISEKYESSETDEQYDYMISHFDTERNSINTFLSNCRHAITDYHIFKKYGFKRDNIEMVII